MEYHYPSEEEVFEGVPLPDVDEELVMIRAEHVGGTVYRHMECQRMPYDFDAYIKKLEDSGFQKIGGVDKPEGRSVVTATYQKGTRVVGVNYNYYWRRINLTVQIAPELPYSAEELYEDIPDLPGASAPEDMGANTYIRVACNADKAFYHAYCDTLKSSGFTVFAENNEGFGNSVFNTAFVRDSLSVSVTHIARTGKTYVSAAKDQPFSNKLVYNAEEVASNPVDASTSLHMMELLVFGASFVFRLKNEHFIIQDGGLPNEARYLLDYLEELSGGEKPVIDGWFITHPHRDHTGVLCCLNWEDGLADRIFVEGIYFSEPAGPVVDFDCGARGDVQLIQEASRLLKTRSGEITPIYRNRTGERYYFNDITADIIFAQEQLPKERYSGDVNDSSTWVMFTVEGQKILLAGDGDIGGMDEIMKAYPGEYLDCDVFSTLHHCHNTTFKFTDYFKKKTVLVTCKTEPQMHPAENGHLKDISDEWFLQGEGTRILTFPYRVGQSKCREHFDWKYHKTS